MKKYVLIVLLFVFSITLSAGDAKYVFYFIGDGMGLSQVNAAELYLNSVSHGGGTDVKHLTVSKFPAQAFYTTNAVDRYITSSAAGGTALATGHKTTIGAISMLPDLKTPLKTLAEAAKASGRKVGIISSVMINHATPAVFYAHVPKRSQYYDIGLQLTESGFDFFGGGAVYKADEGADNVYDLAREAGYHVADSQNAFKRLSKRDGKILFVNPVRESDGSMRYAIDSGTEDITLAEIVRKAADVLENPDGFFIFAEGGKIDWACHENDAATTIHEVIALDDAVAEAVKFYEKYPDETLIVVAADHETGGMTMGFAGTRYDGNFSLFAHQKISYFHFSEKLKALAEGSSPGDTASFMNAVRENFGLGGADPQLALSDYDRARLTKAWNAFLKGRELDRRAPDIFLNYGYYNPAAVTASRMLAEKAGLAWTTWSHTGTPVPVRALGAGADRFRGYFDNSDVAKKIAESMDINLGG